MSLAHLRTRIKFKNYKNAKSQKLYKDSRIYPGCKYKSMFVVFVIRSQDRGSVTADQDYPYDLCPDTREANNFVRTGVPFYTRNVDYPEIENKKKLRRKRRDGKRQEKSGKNPRKPEEKEVKARPPIRTCKKTRAGYGSSEPGIIFQNFNALSEKKIGRPRLWVDRKDSGLRSDLDRLSWCLATDKCDKFNPFSFQFRWLWACRWKTNVWWAFSPFTDGSAPSFVFIFWGVERIKCSADKAKVERL